MADLFTADENSFFMDMENLFNSPGWGRLQKGWQEEHDSIAEDSFFNAKSYEDVELARVRRGMLSELINLPANIARQKESILSERTNGPTYG